MQHHWQQRISEDLDFKLPMLRTSWKAHERLLDQEFYKGEESVKARQNVV